jgi:glycosyltransferase involved in cell wall biosynthesis
MKISYDSQIFSAQTYGGVSRYFCEIASRIAQATNVDVSISAPLYVNEYLREIQTGIVKGFAAPSLGRFDSRYSRLVFRGLSLGMCDLQLRSQCPDIVHETYYFSNALGPSRSKRVLTIYDMIHERFRSQFPLGDKTIRYKELSAKRADHVICISESTRRDVIEILGISPDKTSVIYLGFDLMSDAFNEITENFGGIPSPYLLYVGNRGGYKNFLRLLEAYASSDQLRSDFSLVCFGGGRFTQEEQESVIRHGLSFDRVIQLGGSDKILSKLYANASAFIYPSLYEGFGIPPLEAMAHNCPVICAKTSSIPEVVGDAGEYFDPTDLDSMRAAIERVVCSSAHTKLLISKGRSRLSYFSWDRCAMETLDVYKSLV